MNGVAHNANLDSSSAVFHLVVRVSDWHATPLLLVASTLHRRNLQTDRATMVRLENGQFFVTATVCGANHLVRTTCLDLAGRAGVEEVSVDPIPLGGAPGVAQGQVLACGVM